MPDLPSRKGVLGVFLLLLSCFCIHYLIDRYQSIWLCSFFGLGFFSYYLILKDEKLLWQHVVIVAIMVRLSLFFGLPSLSDDFYRFIWDGKLIDQGLNPFTFIPDQIMDQPVSIRGLDQGLYQSLNSSIYFTIYPPISQFIYWCSARLGDENVFTSVTVLRGFIFLFDLGCIMIIHWLLGGEKSGNKLAVYALNPLVVLELTGNLHFEGVMLFFVLFAICMIYKSNWMIGFISMALGIGVKLIPLMFLPSLFFKLGWKKSLFGYALVAIVMSCLLYPFLSSEFVSGYENSLGLFFKKFEFNAGLFFLFREIGFLWVGYDLVQIIGPMLSLVALFLILWMSWMYGNREVYSYERVFSLILFTQLTFSTTVHPWYVIPLVAFSTRSGYVFPLIWSFLVTFSYLGYHQEGYDAPMVFIYLEYLMVFVMAFFELRGKSFTQLVNNE